MSEKPCGAYFFAFFENFFVPILTSGGLAAVSSSAFAALYSAFGKYDVVHIHAEGPAFFAWLPKMFGKRVVVTVHGIDWQREKWQSGFGSKFIHQGEKNAVKYADEVIVLSKGVQDYFKETYDRETHFIPNGVNVNSLVSMNMWGLTPEFLDVLEHELQELPQDAVEHGLPQEERLKNLLDKVGNPYCYLDNGIIVKLNFAPRGSSTLSECIGRCFKSAS